MFWVGRPVRAKIEQRERALDEFDAVTEGVLVSRGNSFAREGEVYGASK